MAERPMSQHPMAEHRRRPPRLRPTLFGLSCFFLPLTFLLRAFLTKDAPSLVIGAGVSSLVLLSLLLLLFSMRFTGKAVSSDFRAPPLPLRILPGEELSISVNPRRPSLSPGIRFSILWHFSFGERRHICETLLPSNGAGESVLRIPLRGYWSARTYLRATDMFGFFHLDWAYPGEQHVVVPPGFRESSGAGIPGRPSADSATVSRLHDDADEKLERRPYVPGDDPRRIDWKHYARIGDLLLRTGEEGIPLRGRIWLLVIGNSAMDRLDTSLQATSALARRLCRDMLNLRVLLPGENTWGEVQYAENEANNQAWEQRLACSLPSEFHLEHLPAAGERLLLVTHPDEPEAVELALQASSRGCRVSLAYPSPSRISGHRKTPRFSWERLVFREYHNAASIDRKRQRYEQALTRAEFRLSSENLDVRRV